jgi:hypothetical protein
MINAQLNDLVINEDELFNRVLAVGPGDGINRASVVVEDAVSIAKYGVRETVIDFADVATFSELEGRANSFLEQHKEPVTEISLTFFYDTERGPGGQIYEGVALTHDGDEIEYYRFGDNREVKRGDLIRIVIRSLGINTTGVIEELDWEPGSVSMNIGSKRYNLLDVVDGARLAAERGEAALGVSKPISLRASTGNPGCVVQVNPYTSTRAVGIEVYGSTSSTFASSGTPPRNTLLYRGTGSRIELPQLVPGSTYYFVVRAFDSAGRFSAFTSQVSAVAGFIVSGLIGPGQVQQGNIGSGAVTTGAIATGAVTAGTIASGAVTANKITVDGEIVISDISRQAGALSVRNANNAEVLRLGNITGKPGVPSIVFPETAKYGLWGALGTGVFIQGTPKVVKVDRDGLQGYGLGPLFNVAQGSIITASGNRTILSNFEIAQNERYYVLVQPEDVALYSSSNGQNNHGYQLSFSTGLRVNGSFFSGFLLNPGNYTSLEVTAFVEFEKRTTVATVEAIFNYTYVIYSQFV